MKVYKANILNKKDGEEDYVLYCDYLKKESNENLRAPGVYASPDAYLLFNPEQCIYSKMMGQEYPLMEDYVTGLFKYHNQYYFYSIYSRETFNGETTISITRGSVPHYNFFYYYTKVGQND